LICILFQVHGEQAHGNDLLQAEVHENDLLPAVVHGERVHGNDLPQAKVLWERLL
jgi:hypothetical protein